MHLTIAECEAAKQAAADSRQSTATLSLECKPIADFLQAAKARGLKWPAARFLAPGGGELRLSIAGEQSKAPGSIQVKIDDNWIGRVEPSGAVYGRQLEANRAVIDTLLAIAADPAAAAKAYGKLSGHCSFCHTKLTDDRSGSSVEVGYGPVCAKNWGLPHHPTGARRELTTPVPTVAA
jgi:hypothetical protein